MATTPAQSSKMRSALSAVCATMLAGALIGVPVVTAPGAQAASPTEVVGGPRDARPETPVTPRPGTCTIIGTHGRDTLVGTPGDDVICGLGGNDRLIGRGGDDILRGGPGNDLLKGGGGEDGLYGGPGNDRLHGGLSADRLVGGEGRDALGGGRGSDVLDGRDDPAVREVLRCGPGRTDRALADPLDVVRASCEVVRQNDPPTGVLLEPSSVAENEPAGTLVGRLTAVDPDRRDSHTFSLVPGRGSADNASFEVVGSDLRTAESFDFETQERLSDPGAGHRPCRRAGGAAVACHGDGRLRERSACRVDDTVSTDEDVPLDLPISGATSPAANDTDADGDPLTVTDVAAASGGTIELSGATITFTPSRELCGDGAGGFDYTVEDGRTGSDEGHVTVDIVCVDDEPVAVDDAFTVSEDAGATSLAVLDNDSDADGDTLEIGAVTQPDHGTVTITGGGSGLTYAPDADYCNDPPGTSTDAFTYTLTPGGATADVEVTVACDDDAPVAVDDTKTVTEDAAATAIDVLANDTDVDGGPISIASVTQPGNGTVVITDGGVGPDLCAGC